MWYVCGMLYAVLHVCVNCFVVPVCTVSEELYRCCNWDVFSDVNNVH